MRSARTTIIAAPRGRTRPRHTTCTQCTAPEPTVRGEESSSGSQVRVIRCRAVLLGLKHCPPAPHRTRLGGLLNE